MEEKRTYSVADIRRLVDVLRASRDFSEAEIAGMEKLTVLLQRLESMADADIEEAVRRYFKVV